jgi:hypothetical protein
VDFKKYVATTKVNTRKYGERRYGAIYANSEGEVPSLLFPENMTFDEKKEREKEFKETGNLVITNPFSREEKVITPVFFATFELKSYHYVVDDIKEVQE